MICAGVDEVGRGPLAGPVVAAAVVLPKRFELAGLTDSKKLTPKKRLSLSKAIKEQAIHWGVGRVEVDEIDRVNIFNAALLAMQRAVEALGVAPDISLIDGKWAPNLACKTRTLIKGDLYEPAISAASIVAKVARDKEMCALHLQDPHSGFNTNTGDATAQHLSALEAFGACEIHRKSFHPVRKALGIQTRLTFGLTET